MRELAGTRVLVTGAAGFLGASVVQCGAIEIDAIQQRAEMRRRRDAQRRLDHAFDPNYLLNF